MPPDPPYHAEPSSPQTGGANSLVGDVEALIADGKTYIEAELAFQKSRAGFTANRLKGGLLYGAGALAFLHLALIALTVGAVIALAGEVGPWLATGIVVVVLLAAAAVLLLKLRGKFADIRAVFEDSRP